MRTCTKSPCGYIGPLSNAIPPINYKNKWVLGCCVCALALWWLVARETIIENLGITRTSARTHASSSRRRAAGRVTSLSRVRLMLAHVRVSRVYESRCVRNLRVNVRTLARDESATTGDDEHNAWCNSLSRCRRRRRRVEPVIFICCACCA